MSKRDNGVPRRLRWAGVLAAVLVLSTGTAAAQAFWSARVDLEAAPVASGSLSLSTQWVGDWSTWEPLFPGTASDTATLRVTETGAAGTTLRWRATPVVSLAPELAPYVSTQVFVGSCGSATIIAAGSSWGPNGGLLPGQSLDLCVRLTLSPSAPNVAQGKDLLPSISVTADQVIS